MGSRPARAVGQLRALAGVRTAVDDLTAAPSLSTESGSETVAALARNGLGVALALSGEGTAASREHLAAWSYYTQARSRAGLAYTGARLALVHAEGDPDAARWAVESLHQAVGSKDPRAVAHSLEALALVSPDSRAATRALAAATALRRATTAPLPDIQREPLTRRRHVLARMLAPAEFARLWQGATTDPWAAVASW